MNQLPLEKRVQILTLLVEGNSLRSTSRITGCSINTVTKLLIDAGKACQKFHDDTVINLKTTKVQCDEIWSFVYAKNKNVPEEMRDNGKLGHVWTWTAMDADSKLIISWLVGNRENETAMAFIKDVAYRLSNRVQLTTDKMRRYIPPVKEFFKGNVDFAQVTKIYGFNTMQEIRYSTPKCIEIQKKIITGQPDEKHISTSYIERQNLTMRMHMRRFTRLTNAFSKKIENHCYAIAIHFVYYNFCKVHKTLKVTPAMEAGLALRPLAIEGIVELVESN